MTDRVAAVYDLIDTANAGDPTLEDGAPAALLYGQRMTEVLAEFKPDASDHLKLACRGQHVERFIRPRSDYPEGKEGYFAWREGLKKYHAERVGGFMAEAGWPEADRDRVGSLIRKERLKRDPEAQALEDVVCLVFIRWYFADFAAKHPMEKVIDIVAKTGRKMSAEGRAAALALGLPQDIADALAA